MDVTIVGAGVIGLTTALALERHGHRVRIFATDLGEATTSAVAGAVWFPYRAGPPARVAVWAADTRRWLESLGNQPETGVDLLTGFEIVRAEEHTPAPESAAPTATEGARPDTPATPVTRPRPWWAANIDVEVAPAPVIGAPEAWKFSAPRVEPAVFLPWLARTIEATIELGPIGRLADLPGDAIVNCTGLGARELTGDDQLRPLFGQVVVTEPNTVDRTITVTDDRDPDRIFYMIPRREELVLGGCSIPVAPGTVPEIDPAITERVLAQARALGFDVGPIRRVRVGLRPYRPEVRLERDPLDPRIVHNYGHGGAGYTLCHGCAEDVATLLT